MLDAYIIDRIRKEREEQERRQSRVPLHIEPPPGGGPDDERDRSDGAGDQGDRGSVVIDFHL